VRLHHSLLGSKQLCILAKDTLITVDDTAVSTDNNILGDMRAMEEDTTFGRSRKLKDKACAGVDPQCLVSDCKTAVLLSFEPARIYNKQDELTLSSMR